MGSILDKVKGAKVADLGKEKVKENGFNIDKNLIVKSDTSKALVPALDLPGQVKYNASQSSDYINQYPDYTGQISNYV